VTQGQIENLVSGFAKAWQRPPTSEELAGLVRDLVREEVYCREAMALGLDKDDTVIRRRLRQKMEFISDDIAAMPEPTDADLNAYLQRTPTDFAPSKLSRLARCISIRKSTAKILRVISRRYWRG
jgi:hypothetical protein